MAIALTALLAGCGGGGGSSQSTSGGETGGGPGPVPETLDGTAKLIFDTQTGAVRVVPLTPSSRAVFAGQAIKINSNMVLDQPGDTGRRVLNVALQNNAGEPIGIGNDGSISGLKVVFTGFKNIDSGTNLKELTQVTTVVGPTLGFLDGPVASANLKGVTGIAIGPHGTMYLADCLNNRVRKISNGYVSTIAGSGASSSTDGYGTNATIYKPYDLALASDGTLYVSDSGGQKIRRISTNGQVTTVAGVGTSGGAVGTGDVAQFNVPEGLAIGPDGSIYVCDSLNRRIRKIEYTGGDRGLPNSYYVSNFSGSGVFAVNDGTSNTASFKSPRDVACDASGNLYVTDRQANKVRFVSTNGDVVSICGTSTPGALDGPGNTAQFNAPSGISQITDGTSNTLFLTETGNNSMRQASCQPGASPGLATNWSVRWIACTGVAGYTNGRGDLAQFNSPGASAYWNGSLYVTDTGNNSLRQLTCSLGFPVPINGGNATPELPSLAGGDGFTAKQEPYLRYAEGLEAGESTSVRSWQFIVPEGVRVFEAIVRIEAETEFASGLAAAFNPSGYGPGSAQNIVTTFAGTGAADYVNGSLNTASFQNLRHIAFDGAGNAFVVENVGIRRISSDGYVTTVLGGPTNSGGPDAGIGSVVNGNNIFCIAVSPDGQELFFTNNGSHIVRRAQLTGSDPKKPDHWSVTTIAGLSGAASYVDGVGTAARFSTPYGICLSPDGVVYVSEIAGMRVRRLTHIAGTRSDAANWRVALLAGSTTGVTGYTNALGSGATFTNPYTIAAAPNGDVIVGDANTRLRRITPYGMVTTLAGPGLGTGADGTGADASFYSIFGLTVDSSGFVYVADWAHIKRVSPQGQVRTVAGDQYGTVDGLGNQSVFAYVDSLAFSPAGTLYAITGGAAPGAGGDARRTIKTIQRVLTK
ncbi:MAG: hypothetical protein ACAH95_07465 [Fimbriimonas sp.]